MKHLRGFRTFESASASAGWAAAPAGSRAGHEKALSSILGKEDVAEFKKNLDSAIKEEFKKMNKKQIEELVEAATESIKKLESTPTNENMNTLFNGVTNFLKSNLGMGTSLTGLVTGIVSTALTGTKWSGLAAGAGIITASPVALGVSIGILACSAIIFIGQVAYHGNK